MKKLIDKLFSYQGIRFLFVGGLNTIVGYGIYALLLYLNVNYLVANTVSTIIGILHSYIWNRFFTFKSKDKALGEITKFVSVYFISYIIGMCTLYIFKSKLNISPYIAGLINLVITTLISYFGHKYISFRKHDSKIIEGIIDMKKGPSKLVWIILGALLVFCFFMFNHGDLTATATHGKDLLECTLKGQFLDFYDYTKSTAVYLIPIYILFAIWSIPVMIIYKIAGLKMWGILDYGAVKYFLLWWYKLMPVLFTIGTAFVIKKICKEIGLSENKKRWAMFLFLSSPLLIFSQFIFGQYDSICMFLTTLSLYYYLKKDYTKFSVIMSLAITFKMFPLFLFIPLVLLSEKRLLHIAKHRCIGVVGTLISNVLFINSPGFMEAKNFTTDMIDRFFLSGINLFSGVFSIFLFIFVGICVYCYMKKIDNKTEYYTNSIYVCLVLYTSFFAFVLWHPQWIILLVPFLVLGIIINNNVKTSLILSTCISGLYLLLVIYMFPLNADEQMLNGGILPMIFGEYIPQRALMHNVLMKFNILSNSMLTTLFVSVLMINLIIKYPTKDRVKEIEKETKKEEFTDTPKGYLLMGVLPILLFVVPAVLIYFLA